MTFETVRDIIVDTLSIDKEDIKLESNIYKDLDADSLDAVELNMALEEKFGLKIEDEDLAKLQTVKDICDYIDAHKA